MTKHILMVQADELLARSLADQLTAQGYLVAAAPSVTRIDQWLAGKAIDLLLLDAQSVDDTLPAVCQTMRAALGPCPIVVLGVGREGEAALKAAGADACLAKPYRFAELLQHLQDRLRDPPAGGEIAIGAFRLHPIARHLTDDAGRRIHLTEKETAILAYLHRAGARVVSRDELLGQVWGYSNAVSTHTVETHIYRLRRKLAGTAGAEALLSTMAGGYRLN
ncbi:response regulator transcription factor [Telmatospirillum siberiense]|nr:response regulator transcription factor [Telmatospirillum siberiense]